MIESLEANGVKVTDELLDQIDRVARAYQKMERLGQDTKKFDLFGLFKDVRVGNLEIDISLENVFSRSFQENLRALEEEFNKEASGAHLKGTVEGEVSVNLDTKKSERRY